MWAILASGPSMSQALADSVRGRCNVITVSDVYKLAPWADALVSQDKPWWRFHQEAHGFAGRKFSGAHWDGLDVPGLERVPFEAGIQSGTNSALLACEVAVKTFGAKELLLLGVDMKGTHFFGPHPAPLKNTTEQRFEVMKQQFANWRPKGVTVWNCNLDSGLECFPKRSLDECLAGLA